MSDEKELRELDAWIAGNVMEMKVLTTERPLLFHHEKTNGFHCLYSTSDRPSVRIWNGNESCEYRPTTNPADALAVLEKCLDKIATGSLEMYQGCDEGPEFKPCFCIVRFGEKTVNMADTLPLAICRFAQKLFGAEKKSVRSG